MNARSVYVVGRFSTFWRWNHSAGIFWFENVILNTDQGSCIYMFLFNFSGLITCVRACSVAQSCPALCDFMDCSPPGSSVHGITPARILEWAAISSSRGIFPTQGSNPRLLWLLHWKVDSLSLKHSGLIILLLTWVTSAFIWGIRHCLSCWLNQGILFCIYPRTLK